MKYYYIFVLFEDMEFPINFIDVEINLSFQILF